MAYEQGQLNPNSAASSSSSSPPPPYPPDTSSREIRRDIAQTRAEMDQTVDALGERLRPRHLLDDLLDYFQGDGGGSGSTAGGVRQTVKDAGWKVVDKLKQHPVPAALIGAGITWLLFEEDHPSPRYGSRHAGVPRSELTEPGMHSGSYVDARTGRPYDPQTYAHRFARGPAAGEQQGGEGRGQSSAEGAGGPGMMEQAKEKAGEVGGKIADAAGAAKDTVAEWSHQARDAAASAGARTYDAAEYAAERARRGYESTRQTFLRGLDEYPLAMGAAALAVGVMAGLCLPSTRREDELMGEASDRLKDQAKDAAHEAVERGEEVVAATASAARDEARRQGLTPDELARKARDVAGEVKGAAQDAARREGLDPDTLAAKGREVVDRAKETAKRSAKDEARAAKESKPAGG